MIRIVCIESSYGAAANVGGPVHQYTKTFDISGPDADKCAEWLRSIPSHGERSVVGVEFEEVQP